MKILIKDDYFVDPIYEEELKKYYGQ